FERFPNNSIFDLLTYVARIVDIEQTNNDDQSNILSLRLSSNELPPMNCSCNHNEILKQNFINLIQSQFTPISTPSHSYYFYDYENIQTKKFTLDAEMMAKMQKDAQKKKTILVDFYTRIDDGRIDMAEFYEKVKNSSKFFDQDFVLLPMTSTSTSNPMIITQSMDVDDVIDDETIEENDGDE
ncbi:hypothetical protein BLA29_012372, partial [Euroglyphus maynei]